MSVLLKKIHQASSTPCQVVQRSVSELERKSTEPSIDDVLLDAGAARTTRLSKNSILHNPWLRRESLQTEFVGTVLKLCWSLPFDAGKAEDLGSGE